jgi:hypothetical protein
MRLVVVSELKSRAACLCQARWFVVVSSWVLALGTKAALTMVPTSTNRRCVGNRRRLDHRSGRTQLNYREDAESDPHKVPCQNDKRDSQCWQQDYDFSLRYA